MTKNVFFYGSRTVEEKISEELEKEKGIEENKIKQKRVDFMESSFLFYDLKPNFT